MKADYGVDAPTVVRNLFVAAVVALVLSFLLPEITVGRVTFLLRPMFRARRSGAQSAAD